MSDAMNDGKNWNADSLISLERAAFMLGGISVKSVRRMISSGQLPPAVKVLSRPKLALSEVIAAIENLKAKRKSGGMKND